MNLITYSDEDYAQVFRMVVGSTYKDFKNSILYMMVRKLPEDPEVFIYLESNQLGISLGQDGIDVYQYDEYISGDDIISGDQPYTVFAVIISRNTLMRMPPGEYVHSLIEERTDGLREALWRGTLIHSIGPTRP